jgi:hypothetical protein
MPERERSAESIGRAAGRVPGEGGLALLDEAREPTSIELIGRDVDRIARPASHDRRIVAEHGSEARDVRADRCGAAFRRFAGPELVDEPVGRDDLARLQQQQREQCLLAPTSDGKGLTGA